MISGLLIFAGLANFVGTWFLWDFNHAWQELAICSVLGLLVGEICLIGIWLAFGSQPLMLRFFLSLGALFALTCLLIIGFYCFDEHNMPAEIPLIILGIPFVFIGMMCFPLGLVRWKTKRVISRNVAQQDIEAGQFGIRHLLIVTALTSVLLVLGQNTFPKKEFEGGAPWLEILGFISVYMLLSCLVCLLSLASVFDKGRRWLNMVLLAGACLIGPVVAAVVMWNSFSDFRNSLGESIFNSIAYSASMALGLVAVLTAFYIAGYKFQKS